MVSAGSLADQEPAGERAVPALPLKIVLIDCVLSSEGLKKIQSISPQITVVSNARLDQVADADIALGVLPQAHFKNAKKLKWLQSRSTGVEHLVYPEMVNSPVILTNAKGCYAPEIAEHVFGFLFGLTRGIATQIRQNKWSRPASLNPYGPRLVESSDVIEMKDMTMGIIGLGGIGKQIARRAKAMDMYVKAVDIAPMALDQIGNVVDEIDLVDGGGLIRMLQTSDVVVSAAPHTKRSEGMLGEKEFSAMKKGSYFINVSRGKLVKTDALVNALKNGPLAGAGLDVTNPEPLPDDHELWKLPNVIITPHIAGVSQFSWPRTEAVFVENVRRYVEGLPLINQVDKVAGF